MKNIKYIFVVIFSMLIFMRCQNTTEPYNIEQTKINNTDSIIIDSVLTDPFFDFTELKNIDSLIAIEVTLKIIIGDVKEVKKSKYRGREIWHVKMQTKKGRYIIVYVDIQYGIILKAECEDEEQDNDVFDYDIIPKEKFIKLKEAIEIALKEKNGYVIKWEIEYSNKHKWIYKIKVKSKSDGRFYIIHIKAKGAIIIVVENGEDDKDRADSTDTVRFSSQYQITFLKVDYDSSGKSTWYYYVKELDSAQDLSNWVLELPPCVKVISATPVPFELVNPDPNSGLSGIKWETGSSFNEGGFAVTLDSLWEVGEVNVSVKGPDVSKGKISGPKCTKK